MYSNVSPSRNVVPRKPPIKIQAALRRRELDKKTRALSVLLRDNWANMVLKQEREMCALRIQLAQSEADLKEHIDSVIGPASGAERIGAEREGVNKRKERENASEVFIGGVETEVGMVALQVCWGGVLTRWEAMTRWSIFPFALVELMLL